MTSLTEEQLQTLLADPACPWASDLVSDVAVRRVSLPDLVRFASGRVDESADLEGRLDELMVESIGAERLVLVDPWSWPKRQMLRLVGTPAARQVAYEVPADRDVG